MMQQTKEKKTTWFLLALSERNQNRTHSFVLVCSQYVFVPFGVLCVQKYKKMQNKPQACLQNVSVKKETFLNSTHFGFKNQMTKMQLYTTHNVTKCISKLCLRIDKLKGENPSENRLKYLSSNYGKACRPVSSRFNLFTAQYYYIERNSQRVCVRVLHAYSAAPTTLLAHYRLFLLVFVFAFVSSLTLSLSLSSIPRGAMRKSQTRREKNGSVLVGTASSCTTCVQYSTF